MLHFVIILRMKNSLTVTTTMLFSKKIRLVQRPRRRCHGGLPVHALTPLLVMGQSESECCRQLFQSQCQQSHDQRNPRQVLCRRGGSRSHRRLWLGHTHEQTIRPLHGPGTAAMGRLSQCRRRQQSQLLHCPQSRTRHGHSATARCHTQWSTSRLVVVVVVR